MRPAILCVAIAATVVTQCLAHSWYPYRCCGEQDCKPVPCDQLVEDARGWVYLPTGNVFDPVTQVMPSEDRNCHVCLGQTDGRSLCAFIVSVS